MPDTSCTGATADLTACEFSLEPVYDLCVKVILVVVNF